MDITEGQGQPLVTTRHVEEAFRYLTAFELLRETLVVVLEEEGMLVPRNFSAFMQTFREAGVLLYDYGVMLTLSTGAKFQIAIVQTAR